MGKNKTYPGLDIGGTKSAAIIGDSSGNQIDRAGWPYNAKPGQEQMLDAIVKSTIKMTDKYPGLCSIGVSIGGPLDAKNGIIQSPPELH